MRRRPASILAAVRSDERGGISPFIMILLPVLVGFAGLAYDGGLLFAGRREATNVAAAAARAGTNDLAEESIYAGSPELAPTAAATAESFALGQGATTAVARILAVDLVEVEVTREVDMVFLSIFGVQTQTVSAIADSRVRQGGTS